MLRYRFGLTKPLIASSRVRLVSVSPRIRLGSSLEHLLSSRLGLDSPRFGIDSALPRARFGLASPRHRLDFPRPRLSLTTVSPRPRFASASHRLASHRPHTASPRNGLPGLASPRRGVAWTGRFSLRHRHRPRLAATPLLFGLASASTRSRLVLATSSPRPRLAIALPRLDSASPLFRLGLALSSLRLIRSRDHEDFGIASVSPRFRMGLSSPRPRLCLTSASAQLLLASHSASSCLALASATPLPRLVST